MKQRIAASFTVLVSCLAACAALGDEPAAELPVRAVPLDPAHVFTGRVAFQVVNEGIVDGESVIHGSFSNGEYFIHDRSHSAVLGIDETMIMRMNGDSFAPLGAVVNGKFGEVDVSAYLDWNSVHVSGALHQFRAADGVYRRADVDTRVPEGTFMRGAAIYLLPAMPLDSGKVIDLNWYSVLEAKLYAVTMTVEDIVEVTVPAGTFETFKVRQEGGRPGNVIYVTTASPRRIVKVDVVGQPMSLVLLPGS